jgi:ABC-type transport system substrate-binding protein
VTITPFAVSDDLESGLEPEVVEAGELYYTMPDDALPVDQRQFLGLVAPRTAVSMLEITPVIIDLNADAAFDSAKSRASVEGIGGGILLNINALVVRPGGDFFDQSEVGTDAIALAIDWSEILDLETSGGVILPLSGEGTQSVDEANYDPAGASQLLEEIGASGALVFVVIAGANQDTAAYGDFIAGALQEVGLEIEAPLFSTVEEAREFFLEVVAGGQPAILIGG